MCENIKTIILRQIIVLKAEIKCTICLDLFIEPVTLTTCQHTFCLECFKGLFSNKTSPKAIGCPICKRLTNRRAYYLNEHFVATVELIKMYDKLVESLDEKGLDKDSMDERINRIKKFLDDCMMYQGSGPSEDCCVSLSGSSDETDRAVLKMDNNNRPKLKTPKSLIRKTKSLNCTKVKHKYPQKRQRKTVENTNITDKVNIDEYDSPDVCVLEEEENKIVKLLEDDCLRNIENEYKNIKDAEQNNKSKNLNCEKSNKSQKRKHESNSNLNSKSAESNSSKKTVTSTGWSRMKTMKKQIKKKEVKYKQLNVSTENNKSKSKSPQDKLLALVKESKVVLNRLDSSTNESLNQKAPELAGTSTYIKVENISTEVSADKFDSLLQYTEKDKNTNQLEDDVFSLCTQKLQTQQNHEQQKDLNDIKILSAEKNNSNITDDLRKLKNDIENDIEKFVVEAHVHHTSTPVKINKQKENNCDINDAIIKSKESSKVNNSEEFDDVICGTVSTPASSKKIGTIIRRSLRSASKRTPEHEPAVKNKPSPKRKKQSKQNPTYEISSDENISKKQKGNNEKLTEGQNIEETACKYKNTNAENIITEDNNVLKRQDFVKKELKLFSVQKPIMMTTLQGSLNAVNVVLSQCSNYVNSESLFSSPSKGSKKSNTDIETSEKPKVLSDQFHSLPLESNTRSSVNFYATAIPCLKNIENFYDQIISLSQQVISETENFKNVMNCTGEEHDSVVVSFKKKTTKDAEIQTDNITCPKCSHVYDFKSTEKNKSFDEITVVDGFKEINDIDSISKNFSNENRSVIFQNQSDISQQGNVNFNSEQNRSTPSKENSQKSSESDLFTKKVNRKLTYSADTNDTQRRTFKRIRSPTSDSDSESVKSKKSNKNYSKLLFRDDIDIFFESEPSQRIQNLSLSSLTNDRQMETIVKKQLKAIEKADEDKNTPVNSEDTTSKYISILEREYKDAQFDKISKSELPVEKQTFDTAPNTVLDNILGSINLSVFENDNFESDNKNTNKKAQLTTSLTEQKNNTIEKNTDSNIPDVLSASMFLNTDKDQNADDKELDKEVENLTNYNLPDDDSLGSDKDKDTETKQKNNTIKKNTDSNIHDGLSASMFLNTDKVQNADDKELDKEVENLTNQNLPDDDSLGSDKDIFEEDNIVESTPQKSLENKRKRSKFEFAEHLPDPILELLEPPPTVTENLDWIEIAPPPPPEFQDSEKMEEPKLNVQNVSSITPDIFGLNPLDRGFFANSTFISDPTNQTIKEPTQKDVRTESSESENIIPNSDTQEKEARNDQENLTPKNNIPSIPTSSAWRSAKKNLNPIVLAQKEKFSPLQIIVNSNPPKQVISSTPKHQTSILNYVKTPQKENNPNEINKSLSRSCTPAKQSMNNKQNTFVPIRENLQIEVCESPVPQNNSPSTSLMKENKIVNKSSNSSILEKSKNNYCIAYTRVKREEIIAINSLTQKLKAKISRDFDKSITHLIVSVDNQNRIKDHTIKYVLAIAHSVWILSFAWVRDSIEHNQFLPEESYEVLDVCGVPGPKISRLTRLSNPLFKNFTFCCVDPFTSVHKADFENAIVNLGGEVKKSPSELSNSFGKYCLILAEAKETQDFDQYQVWRDKFNVLAVDIEWLSRTVGQYKIISVRPYILCLEKGINDLGYPFALTAPVPETPSQMTMTNTNN